MCARALLLLALVPTLSCSGAQRPGADDPLEGALRWEQQQRVVVVEAGTGREETRRARPGELLVLGGPYSLLPYPYAGEERLEWAFHEGILTVNGAVVGATIDFETDVARLVAAHRGRLRTIEFGGRGEDLTAETLAALEALAADEVSLTLSLGGSEVSRLGEVPPGLARSVRWLIVSGNEAMRRHLLELAGRLPNLSTLRSSDMYTPQDGSSPSISALALSQLSNLEGLRSVAFVGDRIGPAGWRALEELRNLQELSLIRADVTDEDMAHVARLGQLRVLVLASTTGVGDQGVEHLARLEHLEELNLVNTAVTEAGVAALEELLPECRIAGPTQPD